jgi:hypothetical protein
MKPNKKVLKRYLGTDEINADNYPLDKKQNLRLLSFDQLKRQKKGAVLFSVGGAEIIIGKSVLDMDTTVFGRSKYGELI